MGVAQVCKLYKKVAFAHTGPKEAIFTRLRCKQWSCEFCAKKNASIWRAFLKEKLPEVSNEWYLLTLTAHPNTKTEQGSINNIRRNLEKLFKRVKRVFGKIEYVRTFERHPSSRRIHTHIIVSGLAPFVAIGTSVKHRPVAYGCATRASRYGFWSVRTWFKITAHECEIGHICDVQPLVGDTVKAVLYVTKYLTKAQQDLGIKGLRHVQTSRAIGSPKQEGEYHWETASYIVSKMFPPNAKILDINTGEVIDNRHWEVYDFYPHED